MRSSMRLGLVLISCSLVAAGAACSRRPAKLGADGLPVFEGRGFRHPSGDPFHCFDLVTAADGKRHTMCREIQEWCVQSMQQTKAKGNDILSECKEADEVSCFDVGSQTFCYATADECTSLRKEKYGDTAYASACKTLGRDFQPPP